MPIATERNVLFIHIPKTGGTSILQAFTDAGLTLDLDGVGLWERLRAHPRSAEIVRELKAVYPINTVAWFAEKHLPASVLRAFVPDVTWNRCFKFAFVRNPWDVVVSTYFFLKANEAWFASIEPDYARIITGSDFREFVHYYPMVAADSTAMLTDERGELLVDFVGRYEHLEDDFADVCRRAGIAVPLGRLNRSDHAHYREYYDDETRSIVERHFARDIERFGYAF